MSEPESLHVTYRNDRSGAAFLLRFLFLQPFAGPLTKIRKHYDPGSPQLSIPFSVRHSCDVQERKVEDIWIYDINIKNLTPDEASKNRKPKRVYYFAGGSWQTPPDSAHFKMLAELIHRLTQPATISLISCPLAPNSPAEQTFPLLVKLYEALSSQEAFCKEDVTFAGDSSGGNIALALTMYCLQTKELPCSQAPSSLVLISPTVDLTHENPDLAAAAKNDPLETIKMIQESAAAWAQNIDKHDPRLSPIYGPIKVLADCGVKVYGIIAGHDVLSVEAKLFIKRCEEAGVEGRFIIWDRQIHNFPITAPYGIPEGVKALDWFTLALNEGGHNTGSTTNEKFEEIESTGVKSFSRHFLSRRNFSVMAAQETLASNPDTVLGKDK